MGDAADDILSILPMTAAVKKKYDAVNPLGVRGFFRKSLILTNTFEKAIS